MRRLLAIILAVGLTAPVAAAPVPADTRHAVKLTDAKPAVGLVLTVKRTSKHAGNVCTKNDDGDVMSEQMLRYDKVVEYDMEVLEVDGDKVVKFSRTYAKATFEDHHDKSRTQSYEGRTVYFERKGGKVVVSVKGQPPLADQDREELEAEVPDADLNHALHRALEPGKAVKLGDSWSLDPKKLGAAMVAMSRPGGDEEAFKTSCKLTRTYAADNRTWGSLDVDFDMPMKDVENLAYKPGSTLTMKGVIEAPIDGGGGVGTALLDFRLRYKALVNKNMHCEADISGTVEQSVVVKKAAREKK